MDCEVCKVLGAPAKAIASGGAGPGLVFGAQILGPGSRGLALGAQLSQARCTTWLTAAEGGAR